MRNPPWIARDLVLLMASLVIWGIGEGMFFFFQPLYLQQLGADELQIGVILGGYGVAMTVSHIPAGLVSDRFGRKQTMFMAWLLGTIAAWIMALAQSLVPFVIGMLIYGTTIFVAAPMNSYVTMARGRLSVGRAITLVSAVFNLGIVVGPWLGGQVGERLGLQRTYLIAAVLFLISTFVMLLIQSQPVEKPERGSGSSGLRSNHTFLVMQLVVLVVMFAMYLPQPLAPNYLQNIRNLGLDQIGLLFSISGIGVVVINLALGQLPAHAGFLLGQLALGTFTYILWRATGFAWYVIGFFLLGGYRVARSLAAAWVQRMVRSSEIGVAYGITETVGAAATILAPPVAGLLFTSDPNWLFLTTLVAILISLVATISFYYRTRRAAPSAGEQAAGD